MKYEIIPGFILEPEKTEKGYVPLRVLTKEIAESLCLRKLIIKDRDWFHSTIGGEALLTLEMLEKYGGKKLKISTIKKRKLSSSFVFQTSDRDTYTWHPYMFIEYWEHILGEALYKKMEKEKEVEAKKIKTVNGYAFNPCEQSLKVVSRKFLKEKGVDPDKLGVFFTEEMEKRYTGKKLKLKRVDRVNDVPHASCRLYFSDNDTYKWNEYMFQEYWDYIDSTICKTQKPTSADTTAKTKVADTTAKTKVAEALVQNKPDCCPTPNDAQVKPVRDVIKEMDADMVAFMDGFKNKEKESEIAYLAKSLDKYKEDLRAAKLQIEIINKQNVKLIEQNIDLTSKLEESENDKEKFGAEIHKLCSENDRLADENINLFKDNEELKEEIEDLSDEVSKLGKKVKMFLLMSMTGAKQ